MCRINDERIQKHLLAKSDLTFEKALEISQMMESANRDVLDLQSTLSPAPVNVLQKEFFISKLNCYHCGGHHSAVKCRLKDATCYYCKKKGHVAKVCRSRQICPRNFRGKERLQNTDA